MYLRLANLSVRLNSKNALLKARWAEIFGGWQSALEPFPGTSTVSLQLKVVRELLPPVKSALIFRDSRGIVDVYRDARNDIWLYFQAGALVQLNINGAGGETLTATGTITPNAAGTWHLEDITFTALAPLLRRHQHYLVHGAAVQCNGTAVLFVGPSGSGKTTTSLSLFLAGCKYLANDLLLLVREQDTIYVYPVPGALQVRPHTLQLLPALHALVAEERGMRQAASEGGINAMRVELGTHDWAAPSQVSSIFYPYVAQREQSSLQRLPESVALARLLEESIDRWDAETLEAHLDFLMALGRQCEHYALELGRDVGGLAELLLAGRQVTVPVSERG